jgi:class 3 adenylate cyclase/predicted ATPase
MVRFDGRTIDFAAHTYIDVDDRELPLTRAELALLTAFLRSPGSVLSRDHLRQVVGGHGAEAHDRSIDMLVARLRRKVEAEPAKPRLILTVAGAGYKFAVRPHGIKWLLERTPESRPRTAMPIARGRLERRQLTVLACQMAGFAALSTRRDPEDLSEIIDSIRDACAEVLAQANGTPVRFLGDGLLAYFGYPEAREDDVERSVLAGLELVRTIRTLSNRLRCDLRPRVGIATGPVVIGDLSGAGDDDEYGAVGGALSLAVHLQSSAKPHSLVIAGETRELAGRFFKYKRLRAVALEGMAPVPAWLVTGGSEIAGRFEAFRRTRMTEFVGRADEAEQLRRHWSHTCTGAGRVVLVSGEAGIGKSRLATEFERWAGPHAILRFFGSPRRTDASLFVIVNELERAAGVDPADTTTDKLDKLGTLLAKCGKPSGEEVSCIAHLMGLTTASKRVEQLTPRQRREKILGVLRARIEALAARGPILVRIEDAQWIDPTSLELFNAIVDRVPRLRAMVLLTARREFAAPWLALPHAKVISLARLGRHESESLVDRVARSKPLLRVVASEILARADGVPLFLEEITKTVLEGGVLRRGRGRHKGDGGNRPHVPHTLHASLLARLDRLGPGKEIAQAGAVIGREFSHELLRMIVEKPEADLCTMLDQLVASGLIFRRGLPPYATYLFKHALVRDAAYDMLLRPRRQKLHSAVAGALEQRFPETCHTQPELLAHHCREAGDAAKAITYLSAAAECALLRSGTREAVGHLTQAQDLVSALPESDERSHLGLKLEIMLSRAFTALRSYAAPETREAYRRARARCEALGNQAWLPLIMLGQQVGAWSAADHQSGSKVAQEMLAWGERNSAPSVLAVGHMSLGMTLAVLGVLARARGHFEQAIRINRFALPPRPPFLFSDVDGRISSMTYLHDCLLLLGYPDQAAISAKQAEAAANAPGTLTPSLSYSRALAQNHLLRMYMVQRNVEKTAAVGSTLLRLAQEQGYPYFIGTSMICTGWALAQGGEAGRGSELCRQGIAQLQAIASNCWLPRNFALLAECYESAGNVEGRDRALADALQSLESTRERLWEPEIYRLKGRFLLQAGKVPEARACLTKAVRIAGRQQARLLELRAATGLARLLMRSDQPAQARQVLMPVYGWFTEGADQDDLQQASALLEMLPKAPGDRSASRRPTRRSAHGDDTKSTFEDGAKSDKRRSRAIGRTAEP